MEDLLWGALTYWKLQAFSVTWRRFCLCRALWETMSRPFATSGGRSRDRIPAQAHQSWQDRGIIPGDVGSPIGRKERATASDVYQKLREQLNLYSVGYPGAKSGTEIRILGKLFTEKEAQIFLHLSPVPSTDAAIASQQGDSPAEVRTLLNRMYEKAHGYWKVREVPNALRFQGWSDPDGKKSWDQKLK